jgi:predicted RNA binding protein YcfA (HicA-like mRNA interferase family)
VSRLKCTFVEFLAIIKSHGFVFHHQGASSHQRYRGVINGEVRYVDFAPHSMHDDINIKTLESMIRQSGLPKKLFRN